MSTEVRNRIHTVVDRLFPGFLDERKTGIVPFTSSSLYLMEERAGYYLTTWPYLRCKWKKLGALEFAFGKNRPLGQWRQIVQELYDIRLKL
jgi:hypothetical protein